jgi:Na+/H+-dicarboxylate symporter
MGITTGLKSFSTIRTMAVAACVYLLAFTVLSAVMGLLRVRVSNPGYVTHPVV